ncbi:uncharacterized protein LOC127748778 [Frankliniella occidentalis]|uniref:Uncharacterized protein LOC127748778 n=1 Tax=Frankliniella occidentalis TaxID=133901 RepID=A0A9C6TYG6_FRAOC|nr:uncharacterized protein LOC127748778 [Frankliniella occidentalis]
MAFSVRVFVEKREFEFNLENRTDSGFAIIKDIELTENSVIQDKQEIRVTFSPHLQDGNSDDEDYANEETIVSDDDLKIFGISREEWNAFPKIMRDREIICYEKHKLMLSMGYVKTQYVSMIALSKPPAVVVSTTTRSKKSLPFKQRQENIRPDIVTTLDEEAEDDVFEAIEETDSDLAGTSSGVVSLKPPLLITRQPVKQMGKRKLLGKITKRTALPNFSAGLVLLLKKKRLNKTEKVALVTEVEAHLISVTGDSYLDPDEWTIVSDKIVEKYPKQSDVDNEKQSNELKHSLQTSIVSRRYRRQKKGRKNGQTVEGAETDQSSSSIENNETTLIDELKSKNPFERDSFLRLSFLIKSTLTQRAVDHNVENMENVVTEFPHYKNLNLVIYEHSLVQEITLEALKNNAEGLLLRLKQHFSITGNMVDQEVEAIIQLQDQLIPRKYVENQKILPAISAWDESEKEKDLTLLGTTATRHAPWASIILGNNSDGDRTIKRYIIQMLTNGFRSEITNPTVPEVLIGLLSFYFIFDIGYPDAYVSLLRFLEKYVHGKLSWSSRKQRGKQEYKDFVTVFEQT